MLNIRHGMLPDEEVDVITLVTTNADADRINQRELEKLDTPVYQSEALIKGDVPPSMYMNDAEATFKP